MALSLRVAQGMVQAGVAAAEGQGIQVSIVIVDAGGYLIAAARMDQTPLLAPDIALGKAAAAALFRCPSAELAQRWGPGAAIPAAMSIRMGGRFVASQGGLPIFDGAECVGGVGVSGAAPAQDEEVAQAAIEGRAAEGSVPRP